MYTYDRRRRASGLSDVDSLEAEEQVSIIKDVVEDLEKAHEAYSELAPLYKRVASALESNRIGKWATVCERRVKEIEGVLLKLKELESLVLKVNTGFEHLLDQAIETATPPTIGDLHKLPGYTQLESIGKEVEAQIRKWDREWDNYKSPLEEEVDNGEIKSKVIDRIEQLEEDLLSGVTDKHGSGVALGFFAQISDPNYIREWWDDNKPGEDDDGEWGEQQEQGQ